jgi:exodeoxyribonuclease-3
VKKGYSGVAILSTVEPLDVSFSCGVDEIDDEGRLIIAEYKDFFLVSTYVPSSGKN